MSMSTSHANRSARLAASRQYPVQLTTSQFSYVGTVYTATLVGSDNLQRGCTDRPRQLIIHRSFRPASRAFQLNTAPTLS